MKDTKRTTSTTQQDLPLNPPETPHRTIHPQGRRVQERPIDVWKPTIQKQIRDLIERVSLDGEPYENTDIVIEMIVTALKAASSQLGRGDLKVLSRSARELRYAFKIFRAYRNTRKVTIFGSARTKPSDISYKMARAFAKNLVEQGYMIITGAGPGIMQAGNHGAGPNGSFGVNIRLPYEQHPNRYIAKQPTYIDCRYFFTRKLVFVKEASAAAFFPGGFGTLDEAFELLTLVQTGKCDPIPLIFVNAPGRRFWEDLDDFVRGRLLRNGKISKEDLILYKIVDSTDEAIKEIVNYYVNYHSLRYVDDKLVLRFQKPIRADQLNHLNRHFKDILTSGRFQASAPLPEEMNQPELDSLPRLVFKFNRINTGRLRHLIDFMNRSWRPA